jgi:hypothetical protein
MTKRHLIASQFPSLLSAAKQPLVYGRAVLIIYASLVDLCSRIRKFRHSRDYKGQSVAFKEQTEVLINALAAPSGRRMAINKRNKKNKHNLQLMGVLLVFKREPGLWCHQLRMIVFARARVYPVYLEQEGIIGFHDVLYGRHDSGTPLHIINLKKDH